MRLTRIYSDEPLSSGQELLLGVTASNHLLHVVRLQVSMPLVLFDAHGNEFNAQLIGKQKAHARVKVSDSTQADNLESPLYLHLGQAISRSQAMDYSLQKSVELGVNRITPLLTAFNSDKWKAAHLEGCLRHWQSIVVSACEQSGRRHIPQLDPPQILAQWLLQTHSTTRLLLHPRGATRLNTLTSSQNVTLLVGAEGGFSDEEVSQAIQAQFTPICLGPRILRTESAAPAAIAVLQYVAGDF